jgi:transposase InsO family protein
VAADIELDVDVAYLRAQLRRVERENRNLRGGNEVLREAADPLIHQAPARERLAFIYARRDRFSVKLLCKILVTDRGSYYAWVRARGKRVEREQDDRRLTELLRRRFTAPMPVLKLIGDIGCLRTGEGWLCLVTAVDLCGEEVLGYAIAPRMRAGLAVEAIDAAHRTGLVAGNATMHTDRGSRCHSREYRNALRRLEIRRGTSRTESFFATIKAEIRVVAQSRCRSTRHRELDQEL